MRPLLLPCALAFASAVLAAAPARAQIAPDITIADGRTGPESLATLADGTVLIAAQQTPVIYRAAPGATRAQAWIRPKVEPGGNIHGAMPDERTGTLWTCLIGKGNAGLLALDLKTGAQKARYRYRGAEPTFFNDIALAPDGTPYITDSRNARIMRLNRATGRLELYAKGPLLERPNGLVFLGRTLYVGVHRGDLIRIPMTADGRAGPMAPVSLSRPLGRPDGMRAAGPNRIVVAEVVDNIVAHGPKGRAALITLSGDSGTVRTLKDHLWAPSAAAAWHDTALVLESKLGYRSDPAMKGRDPGAVHIYALPLPQE